MAVANLGPAGSSAKKGFAAARRCGVVLMVRAVGTRVTERNLKLERAMEAIMIDLL